MIKVLQNTLSKNRRLKIEAVTKKDDYKTEEPKNIEISPPISLGLTVLVGNRHVFPRSNELTYFNFADTPSQ